MPLSCSSTIGSNGDCRRAREATKDSTAPAPNSRGRRYCRIIAKGFQTAVAAIAVIDLEISAPVVPLTIPMGALAFVLKKK